MESRAHIVISGSVQGIFFRSFVRNHARMREVSGWTRNTQDGCVEAIFEGDKESIQKVIDACKEGPAGAAVTDVRVEWKEPNPEELNGFEIRSVINPLDHRLTTSEADGKRK